MLNAIVNSVTRGSEEPCDLTIYDVKKCFDALWGQECLNDIYDNGITDDRLSLLALENENAKVTIKNSHGLSEQIDIRNIIMQGTVMGSFYCTYTMDKLG